jgi:hypothetical protein
LGESVEQVAPGRSRLLLLVTAEQVAELRDALREAGFGQWWLTR